MTFDQRSVLSAAQQAPAGGESSFFSKPAKTLDPNLFDENNRLKPGVCNLLAGPLRNFLEHELGLKNSSAWLHVWLAGSGASYQWAAPRGNGDLDILFGIDAAGFAENNPDIAGMYPAELAAVIDEELKHLLWPETASTHIGDGVYEVTYFTNPAIGTAISNIHPYAAYKLSPAEHWDITPPRLPDDPASVYSAGWFDSAEREAALAGKIIARWDEVNQQLNGFDPASPSYVNQSVAWRVAADQAQAVFDAVHSGRREAFGESGKGYGDWHNFLWQYLKGRGTIARLREITSARKAVQAKRDQQLYGRTPQGAEVLLSRAVFGSRRPS